MLGATLGMLLLAPAAPVPASPPPPVTSPADRAQATQFAGMVYNVAVNVADLSGRQVGRDDLVRDLFVGAIRGLYEEVGQTAPEEVLQTARKAAVGDLITLLTETRMRLGHAPALAGPRAYFAAVNGFKHGLDPYSGLTSPRVNSHVSIDMDFGVGLELDGVSGPRWSVFRVEHGIATGAFPAFGIVGPIPKPDAVPAPAAFPWRVKRVIAGSPAQRAGLRPGDVITHLNRIEVTAERANKMFVEFAFPTGQAFDPRFGQVPSGHYTLKLRRAGKPQPLDVTLDSEIYTPETVHGVMRLPGGRWDCMIDHEYKIGYVRVGAIEDGAERLDGADRRLAEAVEDLSRRGCRALILDLRWCPGGYVTPGINISGLFLKEGTEIARLDGRNRRAAGLDVYRSNSLPIAFKFLKPHLLVLVGPETIGGGELIAAALQDAAARTDTLRRDCEVMGQRTAGRAAIQNVYPTGFADLQFKVTTGLTLRANGKNRQKTPESKPTDEWGVRPDAGLEVPVTADLAAQLRRWAEDHALRPADSNEALDFDDPLKDPYRATALAHLRKKIGKPGAMN